MKALLWQSAALALVRPVRPKPTFRGRGMGGKERVVCSLTTGCLWWCDDTPERYINQLQPPWWMGESITPWRATGYQSSEAG